MGDHVSDKNLPCPIQHYCYQPILVSTDIENNFAPAKEIRIPKIRPDIMRARVFPGFDQRFPRPE